MSDLSKVWDKAKGILGGVAPLLGTALGGPGGGAVGVILSEVLGVDNEPEKITKALEGLTPEQKTRLLETQEANKAELQKLSIQREIAEVKGDSQNITDVNQTMQVETQQGHRWAGAWRPFWGFLSAVAFFIAVIGIFILVGIAIYQEDFGLLTEIPEIIGELVFLFSVPGAILGVASWHRGVKQRIEAGQQETSLVGALASRIKG